MIFTEEQASQHHCCGPDMCGDAEKYPQSGERVCVGSLCMAWRWKREKVPLSDEQVKRSARVIGLAQALQPDREPMRGYCGLAGEPK